MKLSDEPPGSKTTPRDGMKKAYKHLLFYSPNPDKK